MDGHVFVLRTSLRGLAAVSETLLKCKRVRNNDEMLELHYRPHNIPAGDEQRKKQPGTSSVGRAKTHLLTRRVAPLFSTFVYACLDERVRELQKVVVGQPQLPQRSLERGPEHLVPQGLEAVER